MQQGYLPEAGTVDWPVEPFQSSFVNALDNLGMPRFTRRYPKLLDSLLRQMMQLVYVSLQHCSVCMLFACPVHAMRIPWHHRMHSIEPATEASTMA